MSQAGAHASAASHVGSGSQLNNFDRSFREITRSQIERVLRSPDGKFGDRQIHMRLDGLGSSRLVATINHQSVKIWKEK